MVDRGIRGETTNSSDRVVTDGRRPGAVAGAEVEGPGPAPVGMEPLAAEVLAGNG